MTDHSYANHKFDKIFSATGADDNDNGSDIGHVGQDEELTDEISLTKTGHEDRINDSAYQILDIKHTNTLNGKFTDFDNSLIILLDTTVGSIPCGKKENVNFLLLTLI